MTDYWWWIHDKVSKKKKQQERKEQDIIEPSPELQESGKIDVQEEHASTTIIEKIFGKFKQ